MDKEVIKRILERVAAGTTTATDAEALRAAIWEIVFGPPPGKEEARREEANSERMGSQASVRVGFTRDRYPQGEFHIQNTYRLPGGGMSFDRSRRVQLHQQIAPVTTMLWDVLFDAAAMAKQFEPARVMIRLSAKGLEPTWTTILNTLAVVVAHELHVLVADTAPDPADFA
jgi:hypothetical protein